MVAPEGITFTPDFGAIGTIFGIGEPTGEYDPRKHNLAYFWTFGDPGEFVAPVNIKTEYKDRNYSIGFRSAHVFRNPGTYNVRLDIYGYVANTILHAYSERNITINDPETIFAGSRTYFVSPSSNWANAPVGAQLVSDINDAAGWANEGDGNPYRIMLNRGETYNWGGRRFGFNVSNGSTIHIVPGPGSNSSPILNCTGSFSTGANYDSSYSNKSLVIQGLVMNGQYDPITTIDPESTGSFAFWGDYSPQHILIDRCDVTNFGTGVYIGDKAPRHIYINDTSINGYGGNGIIGNDCSGFNLLGCRIQSNVDSPINNSVNGGGTFRSGGSMLSTIVLSCDFFCRQGWSGIGDGYIAVQPNIRLEAEEIPDRFVCITRSTFEGGFTMLAFNTGFNSNTGFDSNSTIQNSLIEDNYFLGGYQTGDVISCNCPGATIKNNTIVIPQTIQRVGPGLSSAISFSYTGNYNILDTPNIVANNTIVNFTDDSINLISNIDGYTNITSNNNISHQPNIIPPEISGTTLVTSPSLWTPREKGYKSSSIPLMSNTATPTDVAASYDRI
jgi:hypothetical protein